MLFDLRPLIALINRRRARRDPAFRRFYARWLLIYFGFFIVLGVFPSDIFAFVFLGCGLVWLFSRALRE